MKKYLITSPDSYATLEKQLQVHSPDYVLYRDKENPCYSQEAEKFLLMCRNFTGVKAFLHQDIELAKKLGADGVHLTSLQLSEITKAKALKLEVIVSTHSVKEVMQAQELGADSVTYSPIFKTPNKGEPKGIEDLENVLKVCAIKVFALGGIVTSVQVEALEKTSVYGFASIRYFLSH